MNDNASNIFKTDILTHGNIVNPGDVVNLVGRIEKLYLNYLEFDLLEVKVFVTTDDIRVIDVCKSNNIECTTNSNCRGSVDYTIDLYFKKDAMIKHYNVDEEELTGNELDDNLVINEEFLSSELYERLFDDVEEIIQKYDEELIE